MKDLHEELYKELCKEVSECTICHNVMFSPHRKDSNSFVHYKKDGAPSYVNLWNLWKGKLGADIMVIGQDYGFVDETKELTEDGKPLFPTDENLIKKLEFKEKSDLTLYFTNIANCYRKTKSTGAFNKGCLAICANKYMSRLIRIVSPKVIITLGQETFNALAFCDKAKVVCVDPSDEKDKFSEVIKRNYKLVFDEDGLEIPVFPAYHTGVFGTRNRGKDNQEKDWEIIREKIKKELSL